MGSSVVEDSCFYADLTPRVGPGYRMGRDGSFWTKWTVKGKGGRGGFVPCLGNKWKKLKHSRSSSGHRTVMFKGSKKRYLVHRLMLETFVGPCPSGMECRHLNGDPGDNRLDNLCWGTPADNQADRVKHGTSNRGERCACAKLTREDVRTARELWSTGRLSKTALAGKYGVNWQTMSDAIEGKTWAWLDNS
jgi:hypothetical protein